MTPAPMTTMVDLGMVVITNLVALIERGRIEVKNLYNPTRSSAGLLLEVLILFRYSHNPASDPDA